MEEIYLVTGATGHVGRVLVKKLLDLNLRVRALVLPKEEKYILNNVDYVLGDVLNVKDIDNFFNVKEKKITLIHLASMVTILSKGNDKVYDVNINGTRNLLEASLKNKISKFIYVSSVHALKELPYPMVIKESKDLSKDYVVGDYAKSKAEATKMVYEYGIKGLNVNVCFPSGIIGPYDYLENNNSVKTINDMALGKLGVYVDGGYNFVDVRDVCDGIINCINKGQSNQGYILSGHYISVKDLLTTINMIKGRNKKGIKISNVLAKTIAPIAEKISLASKRKPIFTPYSIFTLKTNSNFSNEKAIHELGYKVRRIEDSIKDTIDYYEHKDEYERNFI